MGIQSAYIIIVSYNSMKWIDQCLNSCKTYPVIVIDNASTDGTVEHIRAHFPDITLLSQDTNLGFGKANNIGISHALNQSADYVFLLNQDAYLQQGSIDALIEVHKKNKDYGILSPIHLNGNGTKLDRNFSYYLGYDNNPYFYLDAIKGTLSNLYEVPFVNAAAWLLPKETLMMVGGFDPLFYHYGEDENYCQRVRYHGLKIGILPHAFVYHDREERLKQKVSAFSQKYYEQKIRRFLTVHGNVNTFNEEAMYKALSNYRAKILRARLKLKFGQAHGIKKEYMLLKDKKDQLIKSVALNKAKSTNYLSLD